MSNLSDTTEHIKVQRPELWTLELSLLPTGIDFMLYTEAAGESMHVGSIVVGSGSGVAPLPDHERVKTIENAVYDNPVLLDDYKRVRVLVAAQHFVVLPPDTTDDQASRLLAVAYPESAADTEAVVCRMPRCGQVIAFEMPKGLRSFLDRTFNTPQVYHHLYPLCEHYYRLNSGSGISRMFLNLHENAMDVVVYRRGELLMANTYPFTNLDDAAYFALHVWQSLELDQQVDEIQLTGRREHREELTASLRRYVKYVMPAIYPAAALRLGHDAALAPFDLILLSQCE